METTPTMKPPTAHLPKGNPPPTEEDPTARGALCGARRKDSRVAQDIAEGRSGWPWCGSRAGHGTDHPGYGQCAEHGGCTPAAKMSNRLRLASLAGPAIETLNDIIRDESLAPFARVKAAEALLDRAGYPRRVKLDIEAGEETLLDRLDQHQKSTQAKN